jgi:site-specific DNA recombinase
MSMDRTGEGAGLERQEQACAALALARGWTVVGIVDDTISATTTRLADRPGWRQVVKMIEDGEADLIVAWHLDRVTRSMKDLESLIELAVEKNIGLATATGDIDLTNDVGRMVARILAAVATAETERKAERQILANDQRVKEGRPQWIRRPFGYNLDGTLNEGEAAAVRKAYQDVLNGKFLSTVAREWNEAGFTTTAPNPETARSRQPRKQDYNPSGQWNNVAVRILLRAPRNMAKSTLYGEIMGDAQWTPIVDEETWRAVDKLLTDRERPDGNGGKLSNLLSAIAKCSVCGASMGVDARGRYKDNLVYVCKGWTKKPELGRGHCSIGVDFADGVVVRRLIQQMEKTGRVSFHPEPVSIDTAPLKEREREIATLMAELVEDRTKGFITRAALQDGSAKLQAELAEIQAELAKAGSHGPVEEIDIEAAYEEFDSMELGEQRQVLRDAFVQLQILPRGKGRPKKGEGTWKPGLIDHAFSPAWQ